MTDTTKRKALIFLALTALLMTVIAAALPQLDPGPGIPLPFIQSASGALPEDTFAPLSLSLSTLAKAILLVFLILVVAYCAVAMFRGIPIRDLLRALSSAAIIGAVATAAILLLFAVVNVRVSVIPDQAEVIPPAAEVTGPPPGPMPPFFIWLAWGALCVGIALAAYQIVRQRNQRQRTGDLLAVEAEQAIMALKMGLDLRSVVLSCYRQMSQVLKKEQGIALAATMTAREFERLVDARGIPHAPVHALTQLFEAARYGQHPISQGDEQTAIECLNAIVLHTRTAKEKV